MPRWPDGLIHEACRLRLESPNIGLNVSQPLSLSYLLDPRFVEFLCWLYQRLVYVGGSERVVCKVSDVLVTTRAWSSVSVRKR